MVNNTTRIDSLERRIEYLEWRDSIITNHFSKCSLIENDQVEVGYDNYLRIKDASGLYTLNE